MLKEDASDLHLTVGAPPTIRVHGDLVPLAQYPPLDPDGTQKMIYAILRQKQRERLEQELELDLSYSLPGRARFRVNVYFQRDVVGAAFRLIPTRSGRWRTSASRRSSATWPACRVA